MPTQMSDYDSRVITEADLKTIKDGESRPVGDLNEDVWGTFAAPPPHDVYVLQAFLARDGLTMYQRKDDPTNAYFTASLECRIKSNDELYDDLPVFMRSSTRLNRGREISTMEYVIDKMGGGDILRKLGKVSDRKIAEVLLEVLKREPRIWAEVDWRGSYSYTKKNGETVWENPYRSYLDFPDGEGKVLKQHEVVMTGLDGLRHTVRAQLTVVKIYRRDDKDVPGPGVIPARDAEVMNTRGLVSMPRSKVGPLVNGPETKLVSPVTLTTPGVDQDDMDLLINQ